MSYKIALFTYQGELMCFGHALLNALDLHAKEKEVKLVIEGQSTKLLPDLYKATTLFHREFIQCLEHGLLAAVCQACSMKMGVLDFVKEKELPLGTDMSGHPAVQPFLDSGFQILNY